jgi:hypothetical protein
MHVTCMANYSALWRVVRGSGRLEHHRSLSSRTAPEAWLLHLGTLPRSAECWDYWVREI